jgi:acyl-CoA thioesterase-1
MQPEIVYANGAFKWADGPLPCDIPAGFKRFEHPLPHLVQALNSQRKIKIVAIGSSSTAGEGVMPYPYRLELALRKRFADRMIDVLNRGIGGQEALSELSRFECDVFAEAPTVVIWQVGTNVVFRKEEFNLEDVGKSIATGLGWLSGLATDVLLMDLQYAPAIVNSDKIKFSEEMVSRIADAAGKANVDVFRRFALMKHWHEDNRISFDSMIQADGLHQNDWSTDCATQALFGAIEETVMAAGVA